jgi:hypothetical protein
LNKALQEHSSENWPPVPAWIKNDDPDKLFADGSTYLIAVPVMNNETGKRYWDIDKITVTADEDRCDFYEYGTGEAYGAWDWSDAEYYMELP